MSNVKFWKDDPSYIVVSKPDKNKIKKLWRIAVGSDNIHVETAMAKKCSELIYWHYQSILHYMRGERSNPVPLCLINTVVECSGGRVTKEQFIAANGMVKYKKAEQLLESLQPEMKKVQDLRFKEFRDKMEEEHVSSTYSSFLSDLEYFCTSLDPAIVRIVNENKEKLFSSTCFVMVLREYCNLDREMRRGCLSPERVWRYHAFQFTLTNFIAEKPGWLQRRFANTSI